MRLRTMAATAWLALLAWPHGVDAQPSASDWAATLHNTIETTTGVTYATANGISLQLDIYAPRASRPVPTAVMFHAGGWVVGSRQRDVLKVLPYLEMGMAVVNVSYRLGGASTAPAAVEDCLCALRWVLRNAKQYGFDVTRLVVTGSSAGGHLALTTGMLPLSAGLDRQCPGPEPLTVAAIVNWFGITDVADLLDGPNMRSYAVEWLGSRPDRMEVARRVSPLTYVRRDLPPILTIHGDKDPTVPYTHGVRLHSALLAAGATSEFVTIVGGGHGNFSVPDTRRGFDAVRAFLRRHGVLTGSPSQ